ncbi:sterol desaturase family protein [Paenibacillus koleovorans]|uniref:sterol desaturase family protein n=1 Tax=Paenibacillus koleovorans TaxID=121608 RepID=UPI000FD78B99|nr:sterol desaturase family protein [Paenibacillus koleovorans]
MILFFLTFAAFSGLYFGFAWLTLHLPGHKIDHRPLRKNQIRNEIGLSMISIACFSGIAVVTKWLVELGILEVTWEIVWWKLPLEIAVLFFWNEIHFYLCHRLLHTSWLYRHVHVRHHRSVVPTPYSTYSFHFVEALLLGSVMTTALLFYPFSLVSLMTLPLMSIILNALGHLNADLFPSRPLSHPLAFARRHSMHHSQNSGNYGFFLPWFDMWFRSAIKQKGR